MRTYATLDELEVFPGISIPEDKTSEQLEGLLQQASILVRQATVSARYEVDSAGKPSEDAIKEAFRDATCAQVKVWIDADIWNPSAVALTQPKRSLTSLSMGGRSEGYSGDSAEVTAARVGVASSLHTLALMILESEGLTNQQPLWAR